MQGTPWRLAIDFGTSNSTAAVIQGNGGVRVLRLGARSDAIPSCVAAYNGEILTGDAALQIAAIYPGAFEPTPKRRLGEEGIVLGDTVCDPVDLVAAVFGFILGQATRFVGGGSPAQVVLTHPEAWDEYLKQRLTAAALKAGLSGERLVLMPEPVAAGWHYASGSDVGLGQYVAVLDFGGGTCDAAVLVLAQTPDGPAFHVVASGGIDPLGGHDFDAQLIDWVYSQLAAEGKEALLESLKAERSGADRAVLRDQVREAKHALSFHGSAPIGVRTREHEWVCTVTRGEFEYLIDSQLRRAVQLAQKVIEDALPSVDQLHKVYLTGGSSHVPALQAKLSEFLPMKLGLMGDPKQVTSIGALEAPITAGRIAGSEHLDLAGSATEVAAEVFALGVASDERRADRQGGWAGFWTRRPGTRDPAQAGGSRRRSPVPKWVLIGGGLGATAALLVAAFALASGGTQPIQPPASSSLGTTVAPVGTCAGKERRDLAEGECNLLTRVSGLGLVASDSCTSNKNHAEARYALTCAAPANSNFSSSERPTLYVYGYASSASLQTAFDGVVKRFNATARSANRPPGWETWHLANDNAQAPKGRVLGASEDSLNYLVWTEDELLVEIWAVSKEADVAKLYAWWDR